jgi:predicted TIM-barrel fold metal-dependent hydrolase
MIIDAHVHLFGPNYFPPKWHQITAEKWSKAVVPPRDPTEVIPRIEPGLIDADGSILIQELDRAGIDAGVCLTLDWGYALGDTSGASPEEMMEHYGHLTKKLAGRFYAIAGIDPRRKGALQVYERAIKEWGLRGLKIYPPTGFFPYDEVCFPFYEKSLELGVPVYIHTALMPGYPHRARFANPLGIGEVQYRYPELTIIFAHSGYPIWGEEAIETAQGHPNSHLEISNWNYLINENPEKVVRFLAKARDHMGAHRILFGSDHLGGKRFSGERSILPDWVGFIKSLPERGREYGCEFTQEEVELILGGNAQRVLRIPE